MKKVALSEVKDELSKYLYREWGNEDPEVVAVGPDRGLSVVLGVDEVADRVATALAVEHLRP